MVTTPHDSSFSFSKRHFQWIIKNAGAGWKRRDGGDDDDEEEETPVFTTTSSTSGGEECAATVPAPSPSSKKKHQGTGAAAVAVSRFRAAFMSAMAAGRLHRLGAGAGGLGSRVTGTLFGRRRGHVHFAFQVDPKSSPVLLIELATPTSGLVREMASGLVRIALECEKKPQGITAEAGAKRRLLEEPLWRTYCNGKKCGYAVRRECGPGDWKLLRAVEPVSMGAGVLPAATGKGEDDGEMMYMRARFERVVGSRDSEAFYMMSPDGNGGPELSIYLLRV
ncbi:hypothetical protein Taro_022261 [Colocasia esculenta]|uniref:Protein MIZU-KUSSEI 1 n=1 Tax=Colocasia esculenta TaxID=4460 RepID=A0A843V0Z0_COLES|nr:hypothetical protein [Colocasia esculenta]